MVRIIKTKTKACHHQHHHHENHRPIKTIKDIVSTPPEDLILKRMLNIQNEIYMCYDHLSSCRQFATIWQRTDEENDEIMKTKEDIYITTADDNNKSGTKSISTTAKQQQLLLPLQLGESG